VDIPAYLANPELRKELMTVYIGGYRYTSRSPSPLISGIGLKQHSLIRLRKHIFKVLTAVESFNQYAKDFVDIPICPFNRRANMKN